MTNGRAKGAAGEREFSAAVAGALGVRLVRRLDQCRGGGHDLEADPGDTGARAAWLGRFAPEVKRHRAAPPGAVAEWWRQAVRQAGAVGLAPLLAYRPDRAAWTVVVALDALVPGTAPADGPPHPVAMTLEAFAALAPPGP